MSKVEIYTKPTCGYCMRAKHLLKSRNIAFTEYNLFKMPSKQAEMIQRANGRRTVPQVFIDGKGIGGSDELHALERSGKLDNLLKDQK